jgi:Flp pilus assembly secretin CpaC
MMKVSFSKVLFAAAFFAALTGTSEVRSEEVLHLTPGRALNVKIPGTDNYLGLVGDPETADVFFGPKNDFLSVGKKDGVTNIIVIDKDSGAEMYKATLEVVAEIR